MRLTLCRLMPGVTRNKIRRPRKYNVFYSNAWHKQSEVMVKDEGYRAACESKGIRVYSPEEIFRPYLPDLGTSEEEFEEYANVSPELKHFEHPEDHPHYHSTPCKLFNSTSRLIKGAGFEQAKILTNSVEIQKGLPEKLTKVIAKASDLLPNSEETVSKILMESRIFDATQRKLPHNVAVPNIGWNPVLDRMFRPLPYAESSFSWGRKTKREYGIPQSRQTMSILRGMLYACDNLAVDYPELLTRQHIEESLLRQFFHKDDQYVQISSPLAYLITDKKPLKPYADQETVLQTKNQKLPDLTPLHCLSYFFENNIYLNANAYPVLRDIEGIEEDLPFAHTCIETWHTLNPVGRSDSDYFGRSLIMAFASALGQARIKYGSDVSGDLPEPITVHYVNTDGRRFHFSVFQLNTMDLNGDLKNIVWQTNELTPLFETCDYVNAVPRLEGYNSKVFDHFLAIYLQNTRLVSSL